MIALYEKIDAEMHSVSVTDVHSDNDEG